MDLANRLLLFLDVAEQGSFAKAAELRLQDRSVVSKQIAHLESDLGVRLFNRNTRKLALTAAGAEMVEQAREIRNLLRETQQLAARFHEEPRGILKISAVSFLGREWVHDVVMDFHALYPNVKVELRLNDDLVDLVGEGYDLGIRVGIPEDSSMMIRKLAPVSMHCLASPDFVERFGQPKSLEALAELPAVTYASGRWGRDRLHVELDGKTRILHMRAVYRTNEDRLMVDAAVRGIGYAVLCDYMLADEVETGQLVPILPQSQFETVGDIYALYPHKDAPLKTKLFLDAVEKALMRSIGANRAPIK